LRQVGDLLRRQLDDRDLPMIDKPTPPLPADLDRRGGPTPPGAASFRDEPVVDWNPTGASAAGVKNAHEVERSADFPFRPALRLRALLARL
jgi:hypothetical protein